MYLSNVFKSLKCIYKGIIKKKGPDKKRITYIFEAFKQNLLKV